MSTPTTTTTRIEKIKCWNCKEEFDYSAEIPEKSVLSVYCPFCDKENVIDLNPYKKSQESIFKSATGSGSTSENKQTYQTGHYDFPDQIPGKKPTTD